MGEVLREPVLRELFADVIVKARLSAIEAILRQRAIDSGVELERQSSSQLVTELYALGEIEPPLYDRLLRLMEFRNAVAHGFTPQAAPPDIAEIVRDARDLQSAA